MKRAWLKALSFLPLLFFLSHGQDYDDYGDGNGETKAAPPPEMESCNGVYVAYSLQETLKAFPHVKNKSAQAWKFKSEVQIVNAGKEEVKGWKLFVGFRNREILVMAEGAQLADLDGLPADVSNGTTLQGSPQTDLKTAIETAFDFTQMMVIVKLTGTVFGLKDEDSKPLPKSLKLTNDGWKCPAPTKRDGGGSMYVCCKRDPKAKPKKKKAIKFAERQYGDLVVTYDVLQSFGNNYMAQVTLDNNHPIGRLDNWNLTWEWQHNEFIHSMRGAYARKRDQDNCIYGPIGQYYKDLDFSQVTNCERRPIISDLPPELFNDTKLGKIPFCCRNGIVLPSVMDPTQSRSIFQLQVFKMPPNLNRTAIVPPQKWQVSGHVQPQYKCGPPVRVTPTEFPDANGLASVTLAVASWQVVCNITRPKPQQAKCCVSFSAFWNESAIPCNTCACGCDDSDGKCNPKAKAMLLPPDALLVPFVNRTAKIKAWQQNLHRRVPKKMPCGDNCGVSINWHVDSDHNNGWTARMTLFNWDDEPFKDWFTAIEIPKAYPGYENVYSFNGTKVGQAKNTILFHGLEGLNFLVALQNGTKRWQPKVPGKQQSVISFKKNRKTHGINIVRGDGFPKKIYFNGEECALPPYIPKAAAHQHQSGFLAVILVAVVSFMLMCS